jgi:hypothetical protein
LASNEAKTRRVRGGVEDKRDKRIRQIVFGGGIEIYSTFFPSNTLKIQCKVLFSYQGLG